ncbi:putative kelch repeat protein [Phaeomoniella chlamydospora]|uniref:Putative kelch repeat protein n=1 Tax=Phaeomoniella chlamydospora TaxID=158046 RepID=A0A0G2GW77_PHACM|nr:putative kelch repeat protein [Phaeomoniella chlamydospora]
MMEPVAATAALYGAETAAEGAVAAYFLTKPTLPLKGRLEHVESSVPLPRSSHSLTVIGDRAYVFGGEIEPREPVSNDVEVLIIGRNNAKAESITAKPVDGSEGVPAARVGHTASGARNRMFVFGGRGGAEMTALEENGRLWVFDPKEEGWLYLDPPPGTEYPCPRSYHASSASDDGNVIFIHAGCASDGSRLVDTWAFYLEEGKWARFPDAPGPARGGPALTYGQDMLWRFGGFDGKTELGGQLDYLEVPSTSNATASEWISLPFDFSETEASTTSSIPAPRSLAALHFVATGQGRDYLILALGEGDPSKIGHAGAGKFFQDIWIYQLPAASGYSGAGIKDMIKEKLPGLTGSTKGQWAQLDLTGVEVGAGEKQGGKWTGRGWFASDSTGTKQFLVWGGIDEGNERLGDGWIVVID